MRKIAVTLSKGAVGKTELRNFSVRLTPGDTATLREYFGAPGLGISQGIRMWVAERMDKEGLR